LRFYGRYGFVVDSDYGCGVVSMVRKSVKRWNNLIVFIFCLYILA
jgi:hypothetical protein